MNGVRRSIDPASSDRKRCWKQGHVEKLSLGLRKTTVQWEILKWTNENAFKFIPDPCVPHLGADKSLAPPERKQATATEDFEFHISYL